LITAPISAAATNVTARPPTIPSADDVSLRPNSDVMNELAISPHSAKTSPCAKLISCRIP